MAEFINVGAVTVQENQNVPLNDSIPCPNGYVIHRNGSGIITLRGIVNNPCGTFARYQCMFNGNISIPNGGTVGEIGVALALDGEALQSSRAVITPAAVEEFGNVTSMAIITVPRGCCYTIAVENVSDTTISVANANLTIARIA